MSKKELKSVDEYGAVFDQYSDDFIETVGEKVVECLDSYLTLVAPEPKSYADCRHMASALIDSVLLYLLVEGHVALPEQSVAPADVQEKRKLARQARMARQGAPKSLGDEAEAFLRAAPGQYL